MEGIKVLNYDKHDLPFVISIPHSGTLLTEELKSNLNDRIILANSDWYLDKLYFFLEELGFTVIINKMSRYVVDPNRELKNNLDDSFWHQVIYTKNTYGKPLYKKELTEEEKEFRINKYYKQYHKILNKAIQEKLKYFSKVYLLDLHSFASPIPYDIVLGNNYFKTASYDFSKLLKESFEQYGFKVDYNNHFIGGYIVKHYGNIKNCEAMQIEIAYLKYIDNRNFVEEENPIINEQIFFKAKEDLRKIFLLLKDKIKIDKKW